MKKSKILSAVLISANVLSLAAPTIAYAADQNSSSATTPAQSTTVKKDEKNATSEKDTKQSSDLKENKDSQDAKKETTVKTTDQSTIKIEKNNHDNKNDPDNPQNLKEQTMVIRKVIATSEKDLSSDSLKGINGAKFVVYDVTDLMNTIIKEKLKMDDSDPTDKQIDKAIDKASDSESQDFDDNATTESTDNKGKSTDKSDSKQDESKLPPVYKSSKSSMDKGKSEDSQGKPSSQAPTVDKDKDKSQSSSSADSKKQDSERKDEKSSSQNSATDENSKSDSKTESKSNSEKEKDDSANDALVEQVEEMRKDDTLRKEIASRASKLDPKEMKSFAEVTTEHDSASKKDGVARVKIPIDGKYHAYYVVNTSTPKEAMAKNSDPIVVITPISDDNGKYSPEFTVYPKSEAIPPTPTKPNTPQTPTTNTPGSKQPKQTQPQPQQEQPQHVVTEAKMYQTGHVTGFWNNVVSLVKNLFN